MLIAPRIEARAGVCGGRPCIAGTRMRVTDVLEMLAAGVPEAEILEDFPFLAEADIRAALAYAAASASQPVATAAE